MSGKGRTVKALPVGVSQALTGAHLTGTDTGICALPSSNSK